MTDAARRAAAVGGLLQRQAGIASRAQLADIGVGWATIRNNVAAGRWQVLTPHVVGLQTGPLSAEQVRWLAVLDGGDDCVLSGLSALHGYGLRGFPVERVQTAVPFGRGRPRRHELFLRRVSRRLDDNARHPLRCPPAMRPAVALVDALENISLPLRGCALLAATVQQRLLRPSDLRPAVAGAPTLPKRSLYLAVAGDIEGGAHSLLELDFRRLARSAGLPPPRGQTVRVDSTGRRRYLDVDFDDFACEVDGAVHLKPLSWWDDTWRINDLLIRGKPTLRFPSVGVYLKGDEVVAQLRRAGQRWLRR